MVEVAHKITIGSAEYSSPRNSRLSRLVVQSSLDVPVNSASISMAVPDGLQASPGEKVSIELGEKDDLKPVFTGVVDAAEYRIDELVLHCSGSFRKLIEARFNLLYEKSKAGDVISDIGSRLNADTGDVDSGVEFPVFALTDSESVYDGLRRMAGFCGCDLYSGVDGKLVFTPYKPAETHKFQYGVNVLSLKVEARDLLTKGAAIYGESPASLSQGPESASWFAKKEILGQAGDSSGMVSRRFEAAARTQDLASQFATAAVASFNQGRSVCTLKTPGSPGVQLGHALQVGRMPQQVQNKTFKVTGVEHRIDGRRGFVSTIRGAEV